jgi:PPM family protein phosphatase
MFDAVRRLDSYRKRSEDRAEVIAHPSGLGIIVADGAGGTSGGGAAADTAVMWAKALLSDAQRLPDSAQWASFLSTLDYQISSGDGGQTTAVVASVTEEGVCGASVGDSAAWILNESGVVDLTAGQVRKPLVGTGSAKPVAFHAELLGGTLLLATDGLIKYAPRDEIRHLAMGMDLSAAARKLIDRARLRSGQLQDDVALILCRSIRGS